MRRTNRQRFSSASRNRQRLSPLALGLRSAGGTLALPPNEKRPLIITRLIPPSSSKKIARARLGDLAPTVTEARLTLLRAPAGYGKTILASQWFDQARVAGKQAVWITARSDVSTAADLAAYLLTALDRVRGCEISPTSSSMHQPDRILPVLITLLSSFPNTILIIDDADQLGQEATRLLAGLITEAPEPTMFVLTSRQEFPLRSGRLSAQGRLTEIKAQELRFSDEEACILLRTDPARAAELNQYVEGWPAGLRMLSQTPRGSVQIDRFLEDEVLAPLTTELQDVLLALALSETSSIALCEALTGHAHTRELVEDLNRQGAFLETADEQADGLRLHPRMADLLRRRAEAREPGRLGRLHLQASRWFATHEDVLQSLHQGALSGDAQWLASLLEAECEALALDGRIGIVEKYAKQIPTAVLLLHPRLTAALAWLRTRSLRLDESKLLLRSAQERVNDLFERGELSADRHQELQLHCLHQELMCAVAEQATPRIEALCGQLLSRRKGIKPFMLYSALTQLLSVRRETYQLRGIEELVAEARSALQRDGYRRARVTIASAAGAALFATGKVTRAIEILTRGIEECGGEGLAAIAALPLSEIRYEQDDVQAAHELVEQYLPRARGFGFLDHLAPGHLIKARLAKLAQGAGAAVTVLEEGLNLARASGLRRLELVLGVELIRCQIDLGRRQQAIELGAELGITPNGRSLRPGPNTTFVDETRAAGWFDLYGSAGQQSQALGLASAWSRFGIANAATRTTIRWQLNLAQLFFKCGQMQRATRCLREALRLAEPIGLIRTFVDHGAEVHQLLMQIASAGGGTLQPIDHFVRRLLNSIPAGTESFVRPALLVLSGIEPVSERELEILSLARGGSSNSEIGAVLGLTEGTVKWYFQQIYDKMGVRRRSQAVEVARSAGLIR